MNERIIFTTWTSCSLDFLTCSRQVPGVNIQPSSFSHKIAAKTVGSLVSVKFYKLW